MFTYCEALMTVQLRIPAPPAELKSGRSPVVGPRYGAAHVIVFGAMVADRESCRLAQLHFAQRHMVKREYTCTGSTKEAALCSSKGTQP